METVSFGLHNFRPRPIWRLILHSILYRILDYSSLDFQQKFHENRLSLCNNLIAEHSHLYVHACVNIERQGVDALTHRPLCVAITISISDRLSWDETIGEQRCQTCRWVAGKGNHECSKLENDNA